MFLSNKTATIKKKRLLISDITNENCITKVILYYKSYFVTKLEKSVQHMEKNSEISENTSFSYEMPLELNQELNVVF